jgi:hypothetical protein
LRPLRLHHHCPPFLCLQFPLCRLSLRLHRQCLRLLRLQCPLRRLFLRLPFLRLRSLRRRYPAWHPHYCCRHRPLHVRPRCPQYRLG